MLFLLRSLILTLPSSQRCFSGHCLLWTLSWISWLWGPTVPGAFNISYSWLSWEKLKSVQRSSNWTEVINNFCLPYFSITNLVPVIILPFSGFKMHSLNTPCIYRRLHIFLVNVSCEYLLVDFRFPIAGLPSHLSPQIKKNIRDERCGSWKGAS